MATSSKERENIVEEFFILKKGRLKNSLKNNRQKGELTNFK
jgi:hypothetical protein